ncbi:ATP-binding protein [Microvirga sp. W0021]|uniref:histidine kinase n=1 Tax=Hohaiivirga grylli TaxID=3133970 RepID=A0ABV0BHQ2_9HYPH
MSIKALLGRRSIAARLVFSAVFWSILILLVAGGILTTLYRGNTEQSFDQRLIVYTNNLTSDLVALANPDKDLPSVGDPRFELPLSGWYWQVGRPNGAVQEIRSSKSLFGGSLPSLLKPNEEARFGTIRKGYGAAPDERPLRILERDIDLGKDGRFILRVAGPADEIDNSVSQFRFMLTVTFIMLGLALGVSALLQVRFGLQPLTKLRAALSNIRKGEAERIRGFYPKDIAPLAGEINLLLDTNQEILERARTQVGNLAHALKTPLSVIVNEAETAPKDVSVKIREQAEIMHDQVRHYLDRARAAALVGTLGSLTEIEPIVAAFERTFNKIYRDKNLQIKVNVPAEIRFRGEKQDFEEMVGNLVDNACKWAKSEVTIAARISEDEERLRLHLTIDDDGPGVPEGKRQEMIKRGRRLDESKPGSGLGLSIVAELASLYRGDFQLGTSPQGGLRAEIILPGDVQG